MGRNHSLGSLGIYPEWSSCVARGPSNLLKWAVWVTYSSNTGWKLKENPHYTVTHHPDSGNTNKIALQNINA